MRLLSSIVLLELFVGGQVDAAALNVTEDDIFVLVDRVNRPSVCTMADTKNAGTAKAQTHTWDNPACEEVTVECLTFRELQDRVPETLITAYCDVDNCKIVLQDTTCAAHGLTPGQKIKPKDLRDKIRKKENPSLSDVLHACTIEHETRHAVDGSGVKDCRTEVNAFTDEVSCFDHFISMYCRAPGAEGQMSERDCASLRYNKCKSLGSAALNSCRCDSNHKRPDPCPACYNRCVMVAGNCNQNGPSEGIVSRCRSSETAYCSSDR